MDKQQNQIEEMKKSCTDCMHYEICSLWTTTDLDEEEAYKYCFGRYRSRIPENAVVMMREEFDEDYATKEDRDYWKHKAEIYKEHLKKVLKETAEKIMNDLSSDIIVVNTKEYGNIEVVPVERLQEICNGIIDGE